MPDVQGPANPSAFNTDLVPPTQHDCPIHGEPTKRASCRACNAAYQRGYLQRRRILTPAKEMWRRSRERARRLGIPFEIGDTLIIPECCPVLGVTLTAGGRRSATSPSLDRVDPDLGYTPGNIRIISDRANRLKSNRSVKTLEALAVTGPIELRADYAKVAAYLARELLLKEVRLKGEAEGPVGADWRNIAAFLEAAFQRKPL